MYRERNEDLIQMIHILVSYTIFNVLKIFPPSSRHKFYFIFPQQHHTEQTGKK